MSMRNAGGMDDAGLNPVNHPDIVALAVIEQIKAAEKARKDRIDHLLGERQAKTSVYELEMKQISEELKALGYHKPRMRTTKTAKNGAEK